MDRREGVNRLHFNNYSLGDYQVESITDVQSRRLVYDREGDLSVHSPTIFEKLEGQAVFVRRL